MVTLISILIVHDTKKCVVFEYLNNRYWIFNYEYNLKHKFSKIKIEKLTTLYIL